MKTIRYIWMLLLLFCGTSFTLQAQGLIGCGAQVKHTDSRAVDYLHVNTFVHPNDSTYCVNVKAYNIRSSSGGNGMNPAVINAQMASLNAGFSGSGINFEWDGTIINVDDTTLRNRNYIISSGDFCVTANLGLFSSDIAPYKSETAIDIFFRNNVSYSFANGIANKPQMLLEGLPASNTSVIVHEMGHVLGLFHTRHGTYSNGNNTHCENDDSFPDTKECINGTTAERSVSGDWVHDTKPDPGNYTVANQNGNCSGNLDLVFDYCDPNGGVTYELADIDNFMNAASYSPCQDNFTAGQTNRMRYFLNENGPVPELDLHNAIFTCLVPPEPCDDCNGAQGNANLVFNSLEVAEDCATYTLSFPPISFNCPDTYRVNWNYGTSSTAELNQIGDTASITFATEGLKTVTIKVLRDNGGILEDCGSFDYMFEVDFDCEQNNCPDCEGVIGEILSTLSLAPTDKDCSRYRVEIPNLGECYTGYINWGDNSNLEPLTSNATMIHQYTSGGDKDVSITLYEGNTWVTCQNITTVPVECQSECGKPCIIDAEIIQSNTGCLYYFNGENAGNSCADSQYNWAWTINGNPVGSNSPNLSYDFSGNTGSQAVNLSVSYINNPTVCLDSETLNIVVDCSGPACYQGYSIQFTNEAGGGECATGQAILAGNLSQVASVDWEWALGGYTGTGASNGTTSPIYYPSGNWNGSLIAITATINFTNGTSCSGLIDLFPMECGQGRGLEFDPNEVILSPNPSHGSFRILNTSNDQIEQVIIRNMFGKTVKVVSKGSNEAINLRLQPDGIYFVEIRFKSGISIVKKAILDN